MDDSELELAICEILENLDFKCGGICKRLRSRYDYKINGHKLAVVLRRMSKEGKVTVNRSKGDTGSLRYGRRTSSLKNL